MSKGIEKKLKLKLQGDATAPTVGYTGRRNQASVSRDSHTQTVMQHCSQQPVYEIKHSICQGMERKKKTWRIHTKKYLLFSLKVKKKDLLTEIV